MVSKLWILLNPVSDQVQKHSETALDTPKNEGTESRFPIKVHAIPGKTPAICEFLVVQMWCSNKQGGFSRRAARVSKMFEEHRSSDGTRPDLWEWPVCP